MKILVIGNGFDLAHGLSTRYTDFLEFSSSFLEYEVKREKQVCWDEWFSEKPIRCYIKRLFEEQSNEGDPSKDNTQERIEIRNNAKRTIRDLKELLSNNVWIEYFLEKRDEMTKKGQENWIDFEEEISKIIQSLDKDIHKKKKDNNIDREIKKISNAFLNRKFIANTKQEENECSAEVSRSSFRYIRDKLLDDLNRLIKALEIYLIMCVERTRCNPLPDIMNIQPQYVISFNYTHTYHRTYEKSTEVDYIHGTVNSTQEKRRNNMVLGIDEYLSEDRKDKDLEFIYFKKYYQRIYKKTGCNYKKWVNAIQKEYKEYLESKDDLKQFYKVVALYKLLSQNEIESDLFFDGQVGNIKRKIEKDYLQHNLFIFGHSLDVTDKDILRDLILNDNVNTTIYSLDREAMGKQIVNLVKVIGQSELIRRTGGNMPTIKFVNLQEESQKNRK